MQTVAGYRIDVWLPKSRHTPGVLVFNSPSTHAGDVLTAVAFPVLGLADQSAATLHNNLTRDPLRPFGDTPLGSYIATWLAPALAVESEQHSYGPYARLSLAPFAGDCLKAQQDGRLGLLAHGGPLDSLGQLRPTHGCLRMRDDDIRVLVGSLLPPSFKEPGCGILVQVGVV